MRRIESAMLEAIRDKRNWRSGNSKVLRYTTFSSVFLFNKHIANVQDGVGVIVNVNTLRAWPTPTTMSRLRALGANVYQRNHVVYLDDVAIN
jgi:hypothetical protein